jgi:hypothetical protein
LKIDVRIVFSDHFRTLRDARSGRFSLADFFLFYGIPFLLALYSAIVQTCIDKEVDNISITFFGIFIALLLNVQVAIFGIFQRRWQAPDDFRSMDIQSEKLRERKILLGEVNANISYLVLISCCALSLFLLVYICRYDGWFLSFFTIFLYSHFLLTLLMIIKRSHALFKREYEEE